MQDIVKASLNHEQRNQSLLHYVGVQNVQTEELEEQLRALEQEEKVLIAELAKAEEAGVSSKAQAERAERSAASILAGIAKREEDLAKLCPIVETLCKLTGAIEMVATGGAPASGPPPRHPGRPLALMDVAVRDLRAKAQGLLTAQATRPRDFLQEINTHPTVMEIRDLRSSRSRRRRRPRPDDRHAARRSGGRPDGSLRAARSFYSTSSFFLCSHATHRGISLSSLTVVRVLVRAR